MLPSSSGHVQRAAHYLWNDVHIGQFCTLWCISQRQQCLPVQEVLCSLYRKLEFQIQNPKSCVKNKKKRTWGRSSSTAIFLTSTQLANPVAPNRTLESCGWRRFETSNPTSSSEETYWPLNSDSCLTITKYLLLPNHTLTLIFHNHNLP